MGGRSQAPGKELIAPKVRHVTGGLLLSQRAGEKKRGEQEKQRVRCGRKAKEQCSWDAHASGGGPESRGSPEWGTGEGNRLEKKDQSKWKERQSKQNKNSGGPPEVYHH